LKRSVRERKKEQGKKEAVLYVRMSVNQQGSLVPIVPAI
jgi:hypothetical protein